MKDRKRFGLAVVLCLLAAVALPAGAMAKDPAAPKAPKAMKEAKAPKEAKKKAPAGFVANMQRELNLSAEQQQAVEQLYADKVGADKAWKEANGAKQKELSDKIKAAKDAGDKETVKTLGQQAAELNAQHGKSQDEYMSKIYAVLTPEQKVKWEGFNLYTGQANAFSKLNLTEDQKGQVRQLCDAAAQEAAAKPLPADPKEAQKAKALASKSLKDKITAQVLTDEQRAQLPQPKARAAKPEKLHKKNNATN